MSSIQSVRTVPTKLRVWLRRDAERGDYYALWLLGTLTLLAVPLAASTYWIQLLILANIFAMFTLSWDILSGQTSYISFGHSFFIGIAGYTTAMLTFHLGLPLYFSIPAAIGAVLVAGAIVFVPSLKLRGVYFTFVSLVLPIVATRIVIAQGTVTGGERGLTGLPTITADPVGNYYLSLGIVLVIAFLFWRLSRSDIGAILHMIRQSEELVGNSGINPHKFKLFLFLCSAFVAGIGGAYKVHYLGSVTVDSVLYLGLSINIVIATIIGGRGSIIGAVGGAYVFVIAQSVMNAHMSTSMTLLLFYLAGILFLFRYPDGLFPQVWRTGLDIRTTIGRMLS